MTGAHDETDWNALRDAELARHVESMHKEGFTGPLPADVEFVRFISPDDGAESTHSASATMASMRQRPSTAVLVSSGYPRTCPIGNG